MPAALYPLTLMMPPCIMIFPPFKTRGYVALSGTFGYELDITKLPAEERAMIPGQVALYKKFSDLVRNGDYNRIASYT